MPTPPNVRDEVASASPPQVDEPATSSGEYEKAHAYVEPSLAPLATTSVSLRDDDESPPSSRDLVEVSLEREIRESSRRVCDTIRFDSDAGVALVHLVEGQVAWVVSPHARSFYARLVHDAIITVHEVDLVVALCRAERLNFCEMLVQLELVSEAVLRDVFRKHVAEHVRAALKAPGLRATWERTRVTFTGDLLVPLSELLEPEELARWRELVIEAGGASDDRRTAHRRSANVMASVESTRGRMPMMIEDFSRSGALLRAPCDLPLGSRVTLRMKVGGENLELVATVVRLRRGSSLAPSALGVAWVNVDDDADQAIRRAFGALGGA